MPGDEEDHAQFLDQVYEQMYAVLLVLAIAAIPIGALIFCAVWMVIMFFV